MSPARKTRRVKLSHRGACTCTHLDARHRRLLDMVKLPAVFLLVAIAAAQNSGSWRAGSTPGCFGFGKRATITISLAWFRITQTVNHPSADI